MAFPLCQGTRNDVARVERKRNAGPAAPDVASLHPGYGLHSPNVKERHMASEAPQQMTTAEAVVASLAAHGLDAVYALPGIQNDHLFDALYKAGNRIRTVHTRHEQGSAYMALGAALATGKPEAFAVGNGPRLLNAYPALLTAYSMNAPVLALIGEIPARDIGRNIGHLHELRGQADVI